MDNYLEVLKNEFEAEEGSFLINLRGMDWNKNAFIRLVTAMETCCENIAGQEKLERWLAEGFWYVPQFAFDWASHPEFPKRHSAEYYKATYCLLHELASYFFTGAHPRIDSRNLVKDFLENTEPQNYNLFGLE
ncbi:MAG TPA: hypothetical protein VNB22_09365 [Pyrinomonadaceae bacterium]|jgi:hypothetical protein|nr:hypothetical protein [Pyrinomonadaceae bacterium]